MIYILYSFAKIFIKIGEKSPVFIGGLIVTVFVFVIVVTLKIKLKHKR